MARSTMIANVAGAGELAQRFLLTFAHFAALAFGHAESARDAAADARVVPTDDYVVVFSILNRLLAFCALGTLLLRMLLRRRRTRLSGDGLQDEYDQGFEHVRPPWLRRFDESYRVLRAPTQHECVRA